MFGISFSEIMIIAVLALVLLGPDELPAAAKKLGKALRMLRETTDGFRAEMRQLELGDEGPDSGLGALRDLHKIATDAASLVRSEVRALTELEPAPKVKMAVGLVPALEGRAHEAAAPDAAPAEPVQPDLPGLEAARAPAIEPAPATSHLPTTDGQAR
jgi:sec-independent protein translocase protein TatB